MRIFCEWRHKWRT